MIPKPFLERYILFRVALIILACGLALTKETYAQTTSSQPPGRIPVYTYQIVSVFPHDPAAFTQGLVYDRGVLYEGTGLNGRSTLRQVEIKTGRVLKIRRLADGFFGEGLTVWRDSLIQLTWDTHLGFVYDKESFDLRRRFTYPTDGWGLTHDGRRLILSDGTEVLRFLDPENFSEIGRLEVRDQDGPVKHLNELEYVNGEIWANIWQTDRIARILPLTGRVVGWIDLTGLLKPEDRRPNVDVLNGIAYDPEGDRLFVTGKFWPKLFEIKIVPRERKLGK